MSRHRLPSSTHPRRRLAAGLLGAAVVVAAVVLLVIALIGTGSTPKASGAGDGSGTAPIPSFSPGPTGSARPTSASPNASSRPVSSASRSSAPSGASTAGAAFPVARARSAVRYANAHAMTSAVAVIDLASHRLTTAGDSSAPMLTASVVKTMIATRVLLQGQMHGRDEQLAYLMITQSDNDAAYALYDQVGGDGLLLWIAKHYGIDDLGESPAHPGLWGSTRITAVGMVRFLADVRADPAVWPWLSNAMAHHAAHTNTGEFNGFGLAGLPGAAVKNGWNQDDDPAHPGDCQINTVGFVHGYAVVVLSRGSDDLYDTPGEQVVTTQAKLLFPA